MLFIDFSSACNIIIPNILVVKLLDLGLPTSVCSWIKDFLTDHPQRVKTGPNLSSTITLSTGSPQDCVSSTLLHSVYTHDCIPVHSSYTTIKFADNTTIVELIWGGGCNQPMWMVYSERWSCIQSTTWCWTSQRQRVMLDFRKRHDIDTTQLLYKGSLCRTACKWTGKNIA